MVNAVICVVTAIYASYETGHQSSETEYRLHWTSDKPGYIFHLISAVSEWLAIQSMVFYFLCLYRRMKNFTHWEIIWKLPQSVK